MINVPPGALFSLLLPRNCIEHDTTRDGSDRIGYDRPLWGLSTACAAMVCAEIPPVIASPLLYRPVRVLDTHHDLYEDIVDFRVQTGINIFYRYISHVCVMKVEGNGNPNIILRSTYLMVSYVIPGTLLWRKCVLPGAAVSIPVRHACGNRCTLLVSLKKSMDVASEANGYSMIPQPKYWSHIVVLTRSIWVCQYGNCS